jgi:hypothetical protein
MPRPASDVDPACDERLAAIAAGQGGLFQWRQARSVGFTISQIRTRVRRGAWIVVRRGVLVDAAVMSASPPHLLACAARWLELPNDVAVGHASAGVLHRLPQVEVPAAPTFVVARERRGAFSHAQPAGLPAAHLTTIRGIPVTSPARTLVDLLRAAENRFDAQALADASAAFGITSGDVSGILTWCAGWPGIVQARCAWEFVDARAESPLESRSRLWMRDGGLPVPETQVPIRAPGLSTRVDFLFRAQRTIVESDGRVKYTDPWQEAEPSREGDDVLWKEKLREDRLRDLGFEVVRATWADGADAGADLVRRVLRAFERGARRAV